MFHPNRQLHVVTAGNRTVWQSPWVKGVYAVMADTSGKCFTVQGFGTSVSASDQSEKAGSQALSSSDCSSSLVVDSASEEFTMTSSVSHICNKNFDYFYYKCGEFEVTKYCRSFSNKMKKEQTRNLQCLKFSKPMIWAAPTNQRNCYFCMTDVAAFTSITKHKIQYANVTSIVPLEKKFIEEETAAPEAMNADKMMQVNDDFEEMNPEEKEYLPDGVSQS
ncbi:hypothetical protein EVAR_41419_1 [Eumeta japonica]|uniref:Uncharacterized protein n=1 Tax=Eumeta variegata TaxID=151549 RepID=A0A4C1W3I4_EUMVA|nr:hypothetical protein EVAR_41419_1 [Eumeta japonica]